jgi:hypothetical protein
MNRNMRFAVGLNDPRRRQREFDSAVFFAVQTESRATQTVAAASGVHFIRLELESSEPRVQGREFKTELLIEVVGGPTPSPCPA